MVDYRSLANKGDQLKETQMLRNLSVLIVASAAIFTMGIAHAEQLSFPSSASEWDPIRDPGAATMQRAFRVPATVSSTYVAIDD